MKINSFNEWDPLKAVVVGTVDAFSPGIEVPNVKSNILENAMEIANEAYPQWYLDEVAEDLDDLCGVFKQAGVSVFRPRWTEASPSFSSPNWTAGGYDIYNVRDLHIVFGDTLITSAPSSRFRLFESYALQELFYKYFFEDGFKWISAPLPKLKGKYLHEIQRSISILESVEDKLHQILSGGLNEIYHFLDDNEIIFDAANIIRLGKDVLFLVSSTGNRKAAKWLANILGPDFRVHETHTYRSSHLDSTILPLNSNFVLLNGARVSADTCPKIFENWEKLYFTEVAPVPEEEVLFHQSVRLPIYNKLLEIDAVSTLNHISSPWAGLNVMSIDPQTVLVHDKQIKLINVLEKLKFTVIPIRMRHCYTMLGGLHCTTLDLIREVR